MKGTKKGAAKLILTALGAHWKTSREGKNFLAVSGGVDSMVLLEGMARLASDRGLRSSLSVVHVNHGLRGSESDADEALVKKRAEALSLPFRVFTLAWETKKPSQDACRKEREKIFSSLCAHPSDCVWLAHHLNDQAETIFLRLLRGTGLSGLAGMESEIGIKVRPFLGIPKSVLLEAAQEWGVDWREDSSNSDPIHYDRNWLRHEIFPLLEARRPGFAQKLSALAAEARLARHSGALSGESFPLFSFQPGISFAKPSQQVSLLALRNCYSLSRAHCQRLRELLQSSSGKHEAEGVRFFWSSGVLLSERKVRFIPSLRRLETPTGKGQWESELGAWKISGALEKKSMPEGKGERAKKEFQSLKVPLFFRPAIPVLKAEASPRALLPQRIAAQFEKQIQFTPSELARWWLNLS